MLDCCTIDAHKQVITDLWILENNVWNILSAQRFYEVMQFCWSHVHKTCIVPIFPILGVI